MQISRTPSLKSLVNQVSSATRFLYFKQDTSQQLALRQMVRRKQTPTVPQQGLQLHLQITLCFANNDRCVALSKALMLNREVNHKL